MNLRLSFHRVMFNYQGTGRLATAVVALALAGAGMGSAAAAPADAASAPDAASVSYANGGQITVRPGQSLNDVAIAVTQSHDRATLARASRALFDANPNAFMNHDPSRMRMGAVLTVPALDASGVPAASSAGAASAASPASAPNAGATAGAASGTAQANAAAASAASAAAHAAAPATPAVSAAASAVIGASSAASASVTASSAPVAGSQAAALPASGAHEWSGSIQSSASESAEGAAASGPATTPAAAAAQPVSQPRVQVSSLQQLLALKNRVLMELQKHGIGGRPVATGAPAANVAQPAAGVSATAVAPVHAATSAALASNDIGLSQTELSGAAAVGAALVALLAALRMRRRKRERIAAADAVPADDGAAVRNAVVPASVEHEAEGAAEADAAERVAVEKAAAERAEAERVAAERAEAERAAAEQAAAERVAAERAASERAEAERAAAEQAAAERAAAEHAAAERAESERMAAEQAAAERAEAEHAAERQSAADSEAASHATFPAPDLTVPQHVWHEHPATPAPFEPAQADLNVAPSTPSAFSPEPFSPAHHDNLEGATTAASLAAAAELGAEALPLTPLEPIDEAVPHEAPAHSLQWDDEPAARLEPSLEPQDHSGTSQHVEPPPVAHVPSVPAAPTEFPRDAVDAFGSLDMPLPPRIESPADTVHAPASLSTQPVASPEATAQHSVALPHPDDVPHIADEIAAGTAGHAAVAGLGAGLGASGFGALNLDFDLELPPSPAQPLPAFTPADLSRIARNKLDLAAEYIELGDLSGARALINEVIETNDPATRTDARALLSTLAPLS